jgi:hypothetical protein
MSRNLATNVHRRCTSSKLVTKPSVAVTTGILTGLSALFAFDGRGVSNLLSVLPPCMTVFSVSCKPCYAIANQVKKNASLTGCVKLNTQHLHIIEQIHPHSVGITRLDVETLLDCV